MVFQWSLGIWALVIFFVIWHSSLIRHSGFVIRHLMPSVAPHYTTSLGHAILFHRAGWAIIHRMIDIHTHAFPDDIAPRAMTSLQGRTPAWQAVGDGTVAGLLAALDRAEIDLACVCAIATKPDMVKGILKWQGSFSSDRLVPFCSIHPLDKNPRKWLRRMASQGVPAIKLHPYYQNFVVDDELLFPIYEAAIEFDLAITLHCGRDIGFADDQTDRASAARLAAVVDRFPKIRLLCTHMGGWGEWDEVEKYLVGKDVFFETSFGLTHMPPEQFQRIVAAHGPEKICFGSDWPWNDPATELARIKNIVDEETFKQISFRNACQLLGV